MKQIAVFNPKGGSGKTTITTNLASYFAHSGKKVALADYDSQASSEHWLQRRHNKLPRIQSISAYKRATNTTTVWQNRSAQEIDLIINDFPAAADAAKYHFEINNAHAIIVPVLPSEIDINALKRTLASLLLRARVDQREQKIVIIANRVRENTLIYQRLKLFLYSLEVPFLAHIKDAQCYVQAFEKGKGIFEMPNSNAIQQHQSSWQPLLEWLELKFNY